MKIALRNIFLAGFTVLMSGEYAFAQKIITLESARQMALEKNNQLKIARQNIEAAKAAKIGAKAAMYPGIGAGVTGFYFGKPISDLLPGYGASATLGLSEALYNGGKVKLGRVIAQNDLDVQELQKTLSTSEVLLNVERSYWQIVALNEKLNLLNNYKTLLQALLSDLNNSLSAGTGYKNDVLRARVQLNNADLNILKMKDDLAIAKLSFAQSIGVDPKDAFVINDAVIGPFPTANDRAGDSVDNRSEISLLKKFMDRENLQVDFIKADLKPSIGVSVNGVTATGKKGINPGNDNSNFLGSYYSLLNISIPIWDGGATKQRIKAQTYKQAAQQIQLDDTRQLILIEVKQARLQLNQSVKRIELSNTSLAQAEENLRLSNDRFKAGTIVSKDVIEAQNIWEQANSDLIDAKVQYKISDAVLRKAIGTLK